MHLKIRLQLLTFINGCEGNIDVAVSRIERYFHIKTTCPELFWNRDPDSKELQSAFQVQQMASLPLSPDNCYIFINRLADNDPHKYHFDDVFKMSMMMAGKRGSLYTHDFLEKQVENIDHKARSHDGLGDLSPSFTGKFFNLLGF